MGSTPFPTCTLGDVVLPVPRQSSYLPHRVYTFPVIPCPHQGWGSAPIGLVGTQAAVCTLQRCSHAHLLRFDIVQHCRVSLRSKTRPPLSLSSWGSFFPSLNWV